MAGDWIPYTVDLPRKREVVALSRLCKIRRREVVAILLEFWSWVSNETTDGHLTGVTLEQLPDIISDTKPAFWTTMTLPEIGWIQETEQGLFIPNCERWMSKTAKLRLQERDKKRTQRGRPRPDDVPIETGQPRDKIGTTGEESTEQEKLLALGKEPSASSAQAKLTDPEWLESLGANPAYGHIDLAAEIGRMDAWLSVNPQRKKTRKFIVNWLNRIERPLATVTPIARQRGFMTAGEKTAEASRECMRRAEERERQMAAEGKL